MKLKIVLWDNSKKQKVNADKYNVFFEDGVIDTMQSYLTIDSISIVNDTEDIPN